MPPARFEEVARISVDACTNKAPQALDRRHVLAGRLGANAILLGPADINVAWDGPRDSSEKPRVAAMTTFTAMAIWVPRGPGAAVVWLIEDASLSGVHFDTRQYNFIDYGNVEDLRVRLLNRIKATGV